VELHGQCAVLAPNQFDQLVLELGGQFVDDINNRLSRCVVPLDLAGVWPLASAALFPCFVVSLSKIYASYLGLHDFVVCEFSNDFFLLPCTPRMAVLCFV
jgi:hypothetical protein